uniref:granulocyte-macrophage colony-stimulating factor receptor subunit alpha-like n=1 Tax=Euleptes europaea TaxID=460621 RepID=UPI0025418AA4|nr:granulocyte-macrophage colony-stimulating factor receptor subunit alpha-like [Euleptes europaea]
MVTALGFADVIWCIFVYSIFYAALPDVEGSEPGDIKKNKPYRCIVDGTVTEPHSVVLNLKVDLENMKMTWDFNATIIQCSVDTPPDNCNYGDHDIKGTMCSFDNVQLHQGATFIAKIKYLNQTLSNTTYFPPEEDGTSAENFSCVLYNVSSVNCAWNTGKNAPEDVQYFLYVKNSKDHKEPKRECPHYINNALGRHIACHIPEVSLEPDNDIYYIYVNGSSKKSQIQYYDALLEPCSHERLGPPRNITTNCSQLPSMCRIQWVPPLNNDNCCCPEYEIKDGTNNTIENTIDHYKDIYVEERRIVRIRMFKGNIYGEWSEPITLHIPSQPIPSPTIPLIFLAVGTILMILILFFFCKRHRIWHKITAPVPQPKNLFEQYTKNTEKELMDPIPTAHELEEKITLIEEATNGFKK